MKTIGILLAFSWLSPVARAQSNYITSLHDNDCAQIGTGCQLGVEEVFTSAGQSTTRPYQATFTVDYHFTCTPIGAPLQSRIAVYSADDMGSRKFLDYDTTAALNVDGLGPLRLEDTNSKELADNNQPPGCVLFISASKIVPSTWQLSDWDATRVAVMTDLDSIQKLYDNRPSLAFWRKEYSSNPTAFRGFIQKTITDLQGSLATPCDSDFSDFVTCQLIQSYQDILGNAPDSAIDTLFQQVNAASPPIIQRGRSLVAAKAAAGLSDSELSSKLDNISKLVGL